MERLQVGQWVVDGYGNDFSVMTHENGVVTCWFQRPTGTAKKTIRLLENAVWPVLTKFAPRDWVKAPDGLQYEVLGQFRAQVCCIRCVDKGTKSFHQDTLTKVV